MPLGPPGSTAPIDMNHPWTGNYSCPAGTDKEMAEASVFLCSIVMTETASAQPYEVAHLCMGRHPAWPLDQHERLCEVEMTRSRGEPITPIHLPEFISSYPAESAERAIEARRIDTTETHEDNPRNTGFRSHIPDIGEGMYPIHSVPGAVSTRPTSLYGHQPRDISLHVLDDDAIIRQSQHVGTYPRTPIELNIDFADGTQFTGATPIDRTASTIDEALADPHIQAMSNAFLDYTSDAEERADRVVNSTQAIVMLARLALERRHENHHLLLMDKHEPRFFDYEWHKVYEEHQARDEECDLMIVQIASALSIRRDWFRDNRRRAMRNYMRLRDHAFTFDGHRVLATPANMPFLYGSDRDSTLPADYSFILEIIRRDYMAASIMIAPYAWYRLPPSQNPFGFEPDIIPPARGMDAHTANTALSVLRATYASTTATDGDDEARQQHLISFQQRYSLHQRRGHTFQAFLPLPPLIPPFEPIWPFTFYVPMQRDEYDHWSSPPNERERPYRFTATDRAYRPPYVRPIQSRDEVCHEGPILLVPVSTDLTQDDDPYDHRARGHDIWYRITRRHIRRTMPRIRNLPYFDFGHNNHFYVTRDRPIGETIGHQDPRTASLDYVEQPSHHEPSQTRLSAYDDNHDYIDVESLIPPR